MRLYVIATYQGETIHCTSHIARYVRILRHQTSERDGDSFGNACRCCYVDSLQYQCRRFLNLEGGATINSVVAIFFVRNFHSSGACIGVVFVRNCVLTIRNTSAIVFDHNGRCFSGFIIDSARANLDSRVCYGFRQDFPLYRFCAGVVAVALDGQLVAACVGLRRDLHSIVCIFCQCFTI